MQNKILSKIVLAYLFPVCSIMILTFSHSMLCAQSTPLLTYSVSVQPNQRGQVEIAAQGYNESSITFRILSTDTLLNAIGNIGDVSARNSQGLALSVTALSDGWTVSNPGRGDFTFTYSFGISLNRPGDYSTNFCYVSADGAFFLNEVAFAYPDQLPGRIEVVFQKPSTWTIGTSLTPLGGDRYSVSPFPDLKSALINDSTRMGVAEAVVTQSCDYMSITFVAYKPTSGYENFWYPAYGNSQVQQMQEYIDLNCKSINYLKSVFGFWPGADRYWISTFVTGSVERPANWDHWMQSWPRERYSQVPHHTLHAWLYAGNSDPPLYFNAEESNWFHEGVPTYYESKLTPTLTDNAMWQGALYPNYLIAKRASKLGLLDKRSVNSYALGSMRALAMDRKITEITDGGKSLDNLLAVLGQRYGLAKKSFGREDMLNALTEVTGADLSDFYQSYFNGWVSSQLPPVDGYISDYLGYFMQWLEYQLTSQTFMMSWAKGFRTMFLIDLELGLHAPLGYGSDEHSAATASGLYHLERFRNAIGDSELVTKEKVIETLSSLTGVDQSDFFEFYAALGVTPSVNEIKAWVNYETACTSLTLTPATDEFTYQGGSGSVSIDPSTYNCNWSATSNASWITITSGGSDTGNGVVGYSVAANNGSARAGMITLGAKTFTIAQQASANTYFDTVQKIYIGYYQRPGDPAGLTYWADRLSRSGGNLNEIIEAFANSTESRSLYDTIDSSNIAAVVNDIYITLFGRPAEGEGLSYYVNGFKAGQFTAATIMLNVLYGAQNEDLQSVNNKLTAANLFTRTIDPELDGTNFQVTYAGDGDVIAGRNYLSWYATSTTVPTQAETVAYIKTNIANPGDAIHIN